MPALAVRLHDRDALLAAALEEFRFPWLLRCLPLQRAVTAASAPVKLAAFSTNKQYKTAQKHYKISKKHTSATCDPLTQATTLPVTSLPVVLKRS